MKRIQKSWAILIPVVLLVSSLLFFGSQIESQTARSGPAPSAAPPPPPAGKSPAPPYEEVSPQLAKEKRCLSCHEGIEVINEKMARAWGADKKCEVCHRGNPTAFRKKEAHQGMIINPGDFRVLKEACGQCHDNRGVIRKEIEGLIPSVVKKSRVASQGERNHVPRMLRSLMATAAGEIGAMRYLWGSQAGKEPLYGVREAKDLDGVVPKGSGAVSGLKELPSSGPDVDQMLRHHCLRCHLWTKGEPQPGLYRSSGCSACHVLYGDDGLSETGDPAISKVTPGHPRRHEITVQVPVSQCMHCHNNEGARIGLSYVGQVMNASGVSSGRDGAGKPRRYGVNTLHLKADIHYERGMSCIDCHSSAEVHGDGNLYGRMGEEVAVRCESCHGTLERHGTLKDSRGRPLRNVYRKGSEIILVGKLTGKAHVVPQVAKLAEADALQASMRIPAHLKEMKDRSRLECYACHSRMAPQYYGFQVQGDARRMAPLDWLAGAGEGAKGKAAVGAWSGGFLYVRWEDPVLGVNDRGRVSPLIPLYQTFLTRIDREGKVVLRNQVAKTSRGLPGLGMGPVYPHNVTRQARTCESCHNDPKAMGLGAGYQSSDFVEKEARSQGKGSSTEGWFAPVRDTPAVPFPLEAVVGEDGRPLQDTPAPRGRPFNGPEVERINRIHLCVSCHEEMRDQALWRKAGKDFGFAKTNRKHKEILKRLREESLRREEMEKSHE